MLEAQYLDGVTLASKQPPRRIDDAEAAAIVHMHSGVSHMFVHYRGSKASDGYERRTFQLDVQGEESDDYWAWRKAKAKAVPVWFADGMRTNAVFTATSAGVYTLSPRLADGIVTGVSEVTYPTEIYFDGARDDSKATIGADKASITANDTGEIEVRYMPVRKIAVLHVPEDFRDHNDMALGILFEELVAGDQGT
jgi:hypothetical protein